MKKWLLLLNFVFVAMGATAPSSKISVINLERSKSTVEFLAVSSPSAIKIRGISGETDKALKGTLRIDGFEVSGVAAITLDSLTTGVELRDQHMKDKYLEVKKWPKAELRFAKMKLPRECVEHKCDAAQIPFEGNLSLHGAAKVVTGLANVRKDANLLEAKFTFKVPLSEFGIETPTFMGIRVAQEVSVTADFAAPLIE